MEIANWKRCGRIEYFDLNFKKMHGKLSVRLDIRLFYDSVSTAELLQRRNRYRSVGVKND
jgi:hypothetical protein